MPAGSATFRYRGSAGQREAELGAPTTADNDARVRLVSHALDACLHQGMRHLMMDYFGVNTDEAETDPPDESGVEGE